MVTGRLISIDFHIPHLELLCPWYRKLSSTYIKKLAGMIPCVLSRFLLSCVRVRQKIQLSRIIAIILLKILHTYTNAVTRVLTLFKILRSKRDIFKPRNLSAQEGSNSIIFPSVKHKRSAVTFMTSKEACNVYV